jgi:hypothetical protein
MPPKSKSPQKSKGKDGSEDSGSEDFIQPKKLSQKKRDIFESDEEIEERPKSAPKKKKKAQSSDDDAEEPSQSRGKGKKKLDKSEEDKVVSDLVRFILAADSQKKPIKRADMLKLVFKDHKNISTNMIEKAKAHLKETFGYELVELPNKKGASMIILSNSHN